MNGWQLAALAALGLAACSTTPTTEQPKGGGQDAQTQERVAPPVKPLPPIAGKWTADRIPPGSKIAIAIGQFEPRMTVEEAASDPAVSQGARSGMEVGRLGFLCGPVFIVCVPLLAAVGAGAGAAAGQAKATSNEDAAAKARSRVQDASRSMLFARLLDAQVESYRNQLADSGILRGKGPASPDDAPRYATGDYVIEIAVTDVVAIAPPTSSKRLPYRFGVVAKGRLIRVADNAVVDTFIKRASTTSRTVDQWTAENNAALFSELNSLLAPMVNAFLDEWVLIYRGGAAQPDVAETPESEAGKRTPTYVLRPLEPQLVKNQLWQEDCAGMALNCLMPAPVSALNPTLSWEKLPRAMSDDLFAGSTPRAKHLSYEVHIFSGERPSGRRLMYPGAMVATHMGISDAQLKLEQPLKPCTTYFWTVRAWFELDGRQRATEWSGAYRAHAQRAGDVDPSQLRRGRARSLTQDTYFFPSSTQNTYFFPFETPCPGKPRRIQKPPKAIWD